MRPKGDGELLEISLCLKSGRSSQSLVFSGTIELLCCLVLSLCPVGAAGTWPVLGAGCALPAVQQSRTPRGQWSGALPLPSPAEQAGGAGNEGCTEGGWGFTPL